jgi:prostaglandin-endoperoxide synthase 2
MEVGGGGASPGVSFLMRSPGLVSALQAVPFVRRTVNRVVINRLVGQSPPRPHPYSLWSANGPGGPAQEAYVSWTGLFDRAYTGRHLPPADPGYVAGLPPVEEVVRLFHRKDLIPSRRTSTLFCFFAQWFTDSFLRTDRSDSRKNTSNHEIDLCQIYGLDAATAAVLRERRGGRLRTSETPTGTYPERLFDEAGRVRPHLSGLPSAQRDPDSGQILADLVLGLARLPPEEQARRRPFLYATGLERGNSTILYTAISSVFVREHNRICALLQKAHPGWDDDRLFETARNVNIAMLLRLIVEEYINHLAGLPFKLFVDRTFPERQRWYRTNRIAIEFNLLYRWHSLVPDALEVGGERLDGAGYRFNNEVLERHGAERVIAAASRQRAGRIGLRNTPRFLWEAEKAALGLARAHRVRPYNDYRERFGMGRLRSLEELVGDDAGLAHDLRQLYGGVDKVEFVVGLFAERQDGVSVLGDLMRVMVAVDAFSQALTNPLLSGNVYGEAAFAREGLAVIEETARFEDLVRRNKAPGVADAEVLASFDAA